MELGDGDFLDLDWLRAGNRRLVILTHGLEGHSGAGYIRAAAEALHCAGWDALAWNFRGCSGEENRLPRFYHSGETADLGAVIARGARDYPTVALVGFSLGGNVTLKYLGEAPPHPAVKAGVAISVPVDLAASAGALDRRCSNRIYLRRFLTTMISKIEAKALRFPSEIEARGARRIRSFEEFDGRYTGPLHGFQNAQDYWTRCSARGFLPHIRVPTLLLNARNDPFLPSQCFPIEEAETSEFLFLEAPESGGHVGFLDFQRGLEPWWERRMTQFFQETVAAR